MPTNEIKKVRNYYPPIISNPPKNTLRHPKEWHYTIPKPTYFKKNQIPLVQAFCTRFIILFIYLFSLGPIMALSGLPMSLSFFLIYPIFFNKRNLSFAQICLGVNKLVSSAQLWIYWRPPKTAITIVVLCVSNSNSAWLTDTCVGFCVCVFVCQVLFLQIVNRYNLKTKKNGNLGLGLQLGSLGILICSSCRNFVKYPISLLLPLVAPILIILFSEMLKFSNFNFFSN